LPLAAKLAKSVIPVFDAHADSLLEVVDRGRDLPVADYVKGDVRVQVLACWIDPKIPPQQKFPYLEKLIAACRQQLATFSSDLILARCGREVEEANRQGNIAILLSLEGADAIDRDLEKLAWLKEQGFSAITLTWSRPNAWASSCIDHRDRGLSDLGRDALREMDRLGFIADLSHASQKTFFDTMDAFDGPVILSHSCAYALCPHRRNATDEMLQALQAKGGVIGVNFAPGFLDPDWWAWSKQLAQQEQANVARIVEQLPPDPILRRRVSEEYIRPKLLAKRLPASRILDHVCYIAEKLGTSFVGLGSDFNGVLAFPQGWDGPQDFPALAEGLKSRGFAPEEIVQIMGGNFLRMWHQLNE
jgi:membrane dipeptidase